jgi:hypothetical protein
MTKPKMHFARIRTLVPILLLVLGSIVLLSLLYYHQGHKDRSAIFRECTGHAKGNVHYHATLTIYQDGEKLELPENIGLSGSCIHPLHTHDSTGLIHIDYTDKTKFTLGDLFDVQGIIFNDSQFGAVKTYDGHTIRVFVNEVEIKKNVRGIVFKDKDRIRIRLEMKRE